MISHVDYREHVSARIELAPDEVGFAAASLMEEHASAAEVAVTASLTDFLLAHGVASMQRTGFDLNLEPALGRPELFADDRWPKRGRLRKNPACALQMLGDDKSLIVGTPYLRTWEVPHEWAWFFVGTKRGQDAISFGPVGTSFWDVIFALEVGLLDALYQPRQDIRAEQSHRLMDLESAERGMVESQLRKLGGLWFWWENNVRANWLAYKEKHGDSTLEVRIAELLGKEFFSTDCMSTISLMEETG